MATEKEINEAYEKADDMVVINDVRYTKADAERLGLTSGDTDPDDGDAKARGSRAKVRAPEGNK